jgi:ATP-binding protein involved in chromosome partitioning
MGVIDCDLPTEAVMAAYRHLHASKATATLLLVGENSELPDAVGSPGDEVALKPLPPEALVYRLQALLIRTGRHLPTESGAWASDETLSSAPVAGEGHVVSVFAPKGGVGKTTIAVNLAVSLARDGARVGLLDADITGPNVPLMMGTVGAHVTGNSGRVNPVISHGVKMMSIQYFLTGDAPVIWRGPLIHSAIQQFLRDVEWGELDYLVIDLPPGTGDAALSISQLIPLSGAVVVTTPQEVSLMDARKAIGMFNKVNVRTIGVVENMSGFICPDCGSEHDIFGSGGGTTIARELELEVLGRIPLEPGVRTGGDAGVPITSTQHPSSEDSAAATALRELSRTVAGRISVLAAPFAAATA